MSAQWPWHPITAQSSLRWNIPLLRPDRQTIKRHVNKNIYLSRPDYWVSRISVAFMYFFWKSNIFEYFKNTSHMFILLGSFSFRNEESSLFILQSEQKWLNQQWLTLSSVPGQFLIFDTCSETTGAVAVYWGIWFGHNGDNGHMPSPGGVIYWPISRLGFISQEFL